MAQQVVVCGGGVIGAATAYFLSQRGLKPTVVEAVSPACSASGKAGGFLALDWCDGSPVGPLARRSFQLHNELAKSVPGADWGYRRVKTYSISVKERVAGGKPVRAGRGVSDLPSWVDRGQISQASIIGTEETTAQVHPEVFTKSLLQHVEGKGGRLLAPCRVVGLQQEGGRITGVRVQHGSSGDGVSTSQEVLPADLVVFCMGAWSQQLRDVLPAAPAVGGLKVHSIVVADPQQRTTADALFLAYRGSDGNSLEPEVYPRPNSSVYICGVADEDVPVPDTAADVHPRPEAIAALRSVAASVSQELGAAELLQQQACYLPTTVDGLPAIGRLPGLENAYVATGHSCWGILNAPATGEALAQLITEGCSTIDLTAFDPARLL